MGLLTVSPPPWHPAPRRLRLAASEAQEHTNWWPGQIPNLALGFSLRTAGKLDGGVPLLVGFSKPEEVHECVKVWREVTENFNEKRCINEGQVEEIFEREGFLNWSWSSP
jgi:D-arabinose 1-dehydrogenase